MGKEIIITCLGGESESWFRSLVSELALHRDLSGFLRIYPAQKEIPDDLCQSVKTGENWSCHFFEDPATALKGSDFVLISTLPASESTMKSYAALIRNHCPDVRVLSLAEPMASGLFTLYREFPEIHALGYCSEITELRAFLGGLTSLINTLHPDTVECLRKGQIVSSFFRLLRESPDYSLLSGQNRSVEYHEIDISVQGVCHCSWLNHIQYRDVDLYPYYRSLVSLLSLLRSLGLLWLLPRDVRSTLDMRREQIELFRKHGVVSAYGTDPSTENKLSEAVQLIRAFRGVHNFTTVVCLPNRGFAEDLPEGCIVEINAAFSRNRMVPVQAEKMTESVRTVTRGSISATP